MNEMLPGFGHNQAPPEPLYDLSVYAECQAKARDFADAAGAWLDLGAIVTEEQSERVTDFIKGARDVYAHIEAERKKAKAPHDAKAKQVQSDFMTMLDTVDRTIAKIKPMQAAFLSAKAEEARQEQARRQAEADQLRAKAAMAAAEAAARNDVAGEVEAEALARAAEAATKAAQREIKVQAGSATGGARAMSLRKVWHCEVENINHAFMHFRSDPAVAEVLIRLAEAEVRGQKGEKTAPTGMKLYFEEVAA